MRVSILCYLCGLAVGVAAVVSTLRPPPTLPGRLKFDKVRVYVGTYTDKTTSKGIYRLDLDLATGKLSNKELAAEAKNPSFLAIHPSQQVSLRRATKSPTSAARRAAPSPPSPSTRRPANSPS